MSRQMIQIILVAITIVSIPVIIYLTNDPYKNIVKNTVELSKSEYLDKIMVMGIDFPEDTRIIYENKYYNDSNGGRFPREFEGSNWAFFSKTRIPMPSSGKRDIDKDTGMNFYVFKEEGINIWNNSIKINEFFEKFNRNDISSFSHYWRVGDIKYFSRVYTFGDASIVQLNYTEKKDAVDQNTTAKESPQEAGVLQKQEIVSPSSDSQNEEDDET